jgi:hypothetical protein
MPGDASFVQESFLGGEWSPLAQGRMSLPGYKIAMKVCLNAIPLEEGACNRRSGTRFCATTRNGNPGRLIKFAPQQTTPYNVEFTDGHVRFFFGPLLVFGSDVATVTNISTANPAVVTVATPPAWSNGNQVGFLFQSAQATADCAILRNRQFVINNLSGDQFTLTDPISGLAVDGGTVFWDPTQISAQVARVVDLPSPWTNGSWKTIRGVQAETNIVMLQGQTQPQVITITPAPKAPQFAPFTIAPAAFVDGPYLDPVPGSQLTTSGTSGVITITMGYAPWDNTVTYPSGQFVTSGGFDYVSLVGGNLNNNPALSPSFWQQVNSGGAVGTNGLQQTDVGRQIRIFTEPLPWQPATPYSAGQVVGWNGAYYTALTTNTGLEPDLYLNSWQINPTGALWTWGTIASVLSANSATVQLIGGPLLYTTTVFTWRIGAYSNSTGWPTVGTYYEGRLWLSGAVPNRFDGSNSNNIFVFSPTAPDGTVGDANSVSGVANSEDDNTLTWMKPTSQGILCGSLGGEWLIHASTLNDPITPTSIQFHRVTKYGSGFIEPVSVGFTTCFVQKQGRKILEALADVFSGRFSAPNLTRYAKHLTTAGLAELTYQEELAPVLWARCNDGSLIGCTYRRVSAFASEDPVFFGWHRHILGSGRLVESISAGPSIGGTLDNLSMVTNDPATGIRHVEVMTDLFDANSPITSSWFVDDAVTPSGCQVQTINGKTGVTFYGLWHLNGKTVSVSVGGLDVGDFAIASGSVFVPFGSDANGLFTQAYLTSLETNGVVYPFSTLINTVVTNTPALSPTPATALPIPAPTGTITTSNGTPLVDLVNNLLYQFSTTGPNFGITKTNILTGAQINQAVLANAPTGLPLYTLGFDGSLFYQSSAPFQLNKINPNSLTVTGSIALGSGAGIPHVGATWLAQNAACVQSGGTNYIVTFDQGCDQLNVVNTDNMTFCGFTTLNPPSGNQIPGGAGVMCAGHSGADYGEVFSIVSNASGIALRSLKIAAIDVITCTAANAPLIIAQGQIPVLGLNFPVAANQWNPPGAPIAAWNSGTTYQPGTVVWSGETFPLGYYLSIALSGNTNKNPTGGGNQTFWAPYPVNPCITMQLRNTLAPGAFGTGASAISALSMVVDQSDGNIIVQLTFTGGSTGQGVAKLRASDGTILWFTPLPTTQVVLGASSSQNLNRVIGFTLAIMSPNVDGTGQYPVYVFNTRNGTFTTYHVGGLQNQGGYIFDAVGGRVISYGNLVAGSPGMPTQTPPNANGWVDQWSVFQLGTIFFGSTTAISSGTIPAVIGFTYTTQGQILRPNDREAVGAMTGPGFGKTKRQHQFAALIQAGVVGTMSFGTEFTHLHPANFTDATRRALLSPLTLFSDIWWDTIDDSYSFNSQDCWQISRPVPGIIAAIGGFIHTQDR